MSLFPSTRKARILPDDGPRNGWYEILPTPPPARRAAGTLKADFAVIGAGGRHLYRFEKIQPNSEARHNESWGVLRLLLAPRRYSWAFITDAGQTVDNGEAACVTPAR